MSVSNPGKTVTPQTIDCKGMATVTLSFDAAPTLVQEPADIALVLDRSSSMGGQRIDFTKKGASKLVDMMTEASGGIIGTEIGGSSRIGLISFASSVSVISSLTSDAALLKQKISELAAGGQTNHKDALSAARDMLSLSAKKRRIVVLFTDGITTVGGSPDGEAQLIKNDGMEIYCIGLISDPSMLNKWASDPDSEHVASTSDDTKIEELFSEIALNIIKPSAENVIIDEELNPDFKILHVNPPTRGVYQVVSPQKLRWTIGTTGSAGPETISLSFDIMHTGESGGIKNINKSLTYIDDTGNEPVFPNPVINIDCSGGTVIPEPCPVPQIITADSCQDSLIAELADTPLTSLGRIVQVNTVIKNVCPGKRVALAVLLTETGPDGEEYSRGMKAFTIPAHNGEGCRDISVKCIRFVVPEDLSTAGGSDSLCKKRTFKARVMANYIDTDFICCDGQSAIL